MDMEAAGGEATADGEGEPSEVYERERDREINELLVQHEVEMKDIQTELMKEQQQIEVKHEEEMQQPEILHSLKLEALRLSASNIHTAQLELIQSNLRKEKETALMELREMLKDKHAQELAVLQGQYHFELERINKQNYKEKEEMTLKHQYDMDKERREITLKTEEKYAHMLENLKKEWALNTDITLKNMSEELSAKHQIVFSEMKRTLEVEVEELKGKLERLSFEKEQIEMEHKKMADQYHLTLKNLQTEHEQEVKELTEESKKQERKLQQEIQKLKAESEEEIKQLWSQLDSARASRQELSELKEQLLARTSQMEEIECLKKDFQIKWDKKRSEHENELEQLRVYFEQKLKSVEENYQEELTMLHQRMEEVKDYSLLEIENSQEQHMEHGLSTTLLEETTEKERRELFDQLAQQLEHHKEELNCLQLHLDKKHRKEVELLRYSLSSEYQENLMKMKMDLSDRYTSEIEQLKRKHCLGLEQLRAKISEEHLREIAKLRLQSAQDAARQVETEVAERLLGLENEYKTKLNDLQTKMLSTSSQQEEIEKLRKENAELKEINILQEIHLKEEFEQIKFKLIEAHTAELIRNEEKMQELEHLHKIKAEEWKLEQEDLNIKNEEKLSLLHKDLENKAECEKQALQKQFEFQKAEMTWLQDQQAARIGELEKSLKEQQNNVRQLEDSLANAQKTLSLFDSGLTASKALMAEELEKAKHVLQEEYSVKLKNAENRFMEEGKAMTKNIIAEHEIFLQELKVKHTAELELQNKELQHKHEEQILSVTLNLQTKHQAEIETLKSALETKQQAWLATYVNDIQNDHKAQIAELEAKHLSELNTLESTYLSEIQLLRDEQKQALEDLQVDLRKQLIQKDRTSQMLLAKELDGMKRKHAEDLQVCQDNLKIELATVHIEKLKTMAEELEEAHKEDLRVAVEKQRRLLEDEHHKTLEVLREEIFQLKEQHRNTIQELDNLHTLEVKKEKEKWQQLQKDMEQLSADKQQLEEKNRCLNKEVEDASTELQNLQQQQNRENQEGETLITLLKSDIERCKNEREKLQESYQQVLKLLLKMVKATKDSEDLICKEIGLCPDDSFASGDSGESQNMSGEIVLAKTIAPMEKWTTKKSIVGQEEVLALILPEDSFDSLVPDEISDLSEHLCESIFENPDLVFANEERINKICQSLHVAVKKLLDLVAESTKQLEEMHNIHLHEEEEFTRKNLEACQVVNEHHELVDCLNEESKVKNQLELELHKTRGLMEGYLAERHALQESLKLKEESECRLVRELETLKAELQELNQKFERSVEEQKLLMSQNKILAASIGEQDVDLIKEIEHLAKVKLEVQCQAEKDCSTLNAQMKILEMELEEQLNKNQNLPMMSLEVTDLRQQVQFLERQLKNQRDFMDKQAIEREHERDEFQEEIQKLEMELKLTAKFQASGQSSLVDSLYSEIKEKTEDLNRLFLEKEHMQKDLAVQNEQIKKLEAQTRELEHKNKEEANKANQLTQELQKMKKMEAELKQDKEALQQQNHNNLIQISALHSKLDEAKHKMLTGWNSNHVLNEQLKVQEELISKTREIESLLEQLEQYKISLVNKNEEVLQLSSKLEVERNVNYTQIIQLKEENEHLKENVAKIIMPSQNSDDSELVVLQFLKSLLEEKNQETDHLNEQIVRLQCKIENSKENEILKNQEREIQDLKSIIEHLHDDKEQLLKNKIEETEQLQKVIEKLQKELACLTPLCQEAGNSHNNLNSFAVVEQKDIQNKMKSGLPSHQMSGGKDDNCISLTSNQNKIQDQLEIVLADTGALQKLLEEKEFQFKAEIQILEQNLKNVQESSLQHFTKLTALHLQYKELEEEHKCLQESLLQRDMERTRFTICIQELEDKLREKETNFLQRELQLQRMSEEKSEQAIELQQIKEKFMQLDSEHHALAQTLHDKEATYQREVSEFQVTLTELKLEIENKMEELEVLKSERDLFYSQLKSHLEKDQDDDGGEMNLNKLVPDLGDFVSNKEVGEEEEEKEPSNKLLSSPGFSYRNKLEKDIAVSNLNAPNKSLNLQDKYLQSMICTEEGKIINDKKEKNLQPAFQQLCQLDHLSQSTQFIQKIPDSFQSMVLDKTSWDSPEILRKQNSLELQPGLPLTPFSDVDSTTIGSEGLSSENSVIQQDTHGLLELPVSNSNGSEEIGTSLFLQAITFPGSTFSVTEYDDAQENISVSNTERFSLMPPDLQDDLRITMSRLEDASTEYASNACSDLVLQLNQEESKTAVQQDGGVMTYLQCFGVVPDVTEPAMKEKEMFSHQLKRVLKMVYEESYKILVLSDKSQTSYDKEKAPSVEGWQRERLTLLDTVQSLKDYLSKVPDKENKENASSFFDWRGELLQSVQCVLEKERIMFQSYLQSQFHNPGSGDEGTLIEKLEHIMEQQEQQQKIVLEHLLSSDRNSLLTEIQDLEAQLRLMHLESQEKLQQLQEMLINTENHGSNQEHQLRRQVELLEYKLQQEKSIASDLQASLKREQEKASEVHELLKQEHTVIFNLKSDLCESKQVNERLQKSLQELQKEVVKYSSALESKEKAITAVFQDLQNEKLKEQELQNMLDEQQQENKLREDEKSKAIEELQAALELQCIQNNQLSVALEHEQSANSNLRKELQIEHSRCEALLSQDQNKLLELQKVIEVEKNRSLELLSALNHERLLTEHLSMRINENNFTAERENKCGSCKHKGLLQELQAQLYIERSHARELLGIIEKTQQQVLDSKKEIDKMQMYHEEPEKEQDLHISLQVTHELQNKKQDIVHSLETQRGKESEMKKVWKQLQSDLTSLRSQENWTEQAVRDQSQELMTEYNKLEELQKAQEDRHEFEVQQNQNAGRIKELQQMLKDLKKQGQYFNCHKNQHEPTSCHLDINYTADSIKLHVEQQKLENIREQLICAAAYLSEFICKTIDKTVNWPASNDDVVAVLLHILELKAELLASSKPMIIPTCVTSFIKESEELACQEEKSVLHNCYEAKTSNFVMEAKSPVASSNLKMQKLYRKYLRAESFRKALVYQKKYLLLLLGGFQECEKATLSLIARMGIYPSLPDLNGSESRSRLFIKFRSAVRVVIAISRLKFLVKKWHKVSRKDQPSAAISASTGHHSYPQVRPETLKLQQPFSGDATQEAGYCSTKDLMRHTNTNSSPKSPPLQLHERFTNSTSQASSKDPEKSLTEYIAHLEAIQQRLGILMPGWSPQNEAL